MQQFNQSKLSVLTLLLLSVLISGCANKYKAISLNDSTVVKGKLIYENDFDDLSDWTIEQMPGGTAKINQEKLEINDKSGCTIWLNEKFEGSIMIEYDAFIIKDGGPNDRVSDMNCFWMAKDVAHPSNLFENSEKRGGKFSNYDSLQLYYMGVGGHDNSKTRFRRYVGNGDRPLLAEHDLSAPEYLLEPNKLYKIKIVSLGGIIQYYRNDKLLVDFRDTKPYSSGHFGFRTVNNHMTIDNFRVYRLKDLK